MSTLERPERRNVDEDHERYAEIFRKEGAALFAFALDHRDDEDYTSKLLGYCGAGGNTEAFSFFMSDLFNCYLAGEGIRDGAALMREHQADYRQDFNRMLVQVFGAAYQELLSPPMVEALWHSTHTMLHEKYGV